MYEADSYEVDGVPVKLYYDETPRDPYEDFDQASRLVWIYGSRNVPRDAETVDGERGGRVAQRYLTLFDGEALAIPFYYADYGSNGCRAFITDADSCSGFVCVSRETVQKEWDGDVEAAERCAVSELKTFSQYLEGDVYGYVVAPDSPEEDSCWGFYGIEDVREAAKEAVEYAAPERAKRLRMEAFHSFHPSTL